MDSPANAPARCGFLRWVGGNRSLAVALSVGPGVIARHDFGRSPEGRHSNNRGFDASVGSPWGGAN